MPVLPGAELSFAELPGRLSADPLSAWEGRPGCSVRVVRVPPGPRTPHRHPHSVEVVYVVEGNGRVWEGEQVTPVAAGDLVLVPAGTPHATVATGSSDLVLVCFFPYPELSANIEELAGPVRG